MKITFLTTNDGKYKDAKSVCDLHGIDILQAVADIDELQSDDPVKIALDKSDKAYELIKSPVVITDDSWQFHGLKGFPGPYMHAINEWFTAEDYLRLTLGIKDKRVTLTQYLVFNDGGQQKVFKGENHGTLLSEVRGSYHHPSHSIISLDGDNGLSIAESHQQARDRSSRTPAVVWHDFASWFIKELNR